MAGNRNKRRYGSNTKKKTPMGVWVGLAIVLLTVGIVAAVVLVPQSPYYIGGDGGEVETDTSTITLLSYVDGEDVSNFVEVSIWVPDDDAEFDEEEDIYTLSNFEEEETSKDAEDVSIDISDYSYVWVEIDPDGESVFENMFYLIYGGSNRDYSFYVYHLTSDVNFNLFARDTLDEITVASYATDSNVSLIFDCPHYTTSNIHANSDDWAMTDDDWDEASASEQAEYYDEANWRCQAVEYDPTVDDEKDPDDELSSITEAFCFKLDFNESVSTTNGNNHQINMTLADTDAPVEIVISGDLIYLIFYETIDFEDGAQVLTFEIEFGAWISLEDIDSGRIVLPEDDDNLGTFTKYSDIGA